jgi:hypothetical protein
MRLSTRDGPLLMEWRRWYAPTSSNKGEAISFTFFIAHWSDVWRANYVWCLYLGSTATIRPQFLFFFFFRLTQQYIVQRYYQLKITDCAFLVREKNVNYGGKLWLHERRGSWDGRF